MFSGFKNQMNTWMQSTKPTDENNDKNFSKTFSKIGGYLPKLLKSDQDNVNVQVESSEIISTKIDKQVIDSDVRVDNKDFKDVDDDRSSSTGGADSKPESVNDSPTENIQFKDTVSKKAKTFSNFLYGAVNKAGKTVTEAGAKIKKTVEENSILAEFNREKESLPEVVLPWTNCTNENAVREDILSLSNDKRNFVKCPPVGIDFQFDYDQYYRVALAIMNEDPKLEQLRFELVPKIISEENFWRNYFYRINLICQANEAPKINYQESLETEPEDSPECERENELNDYEVIANDENIHK